MRVGDRGGVGGQGRGWGDRDEGWGYGGWGSGTGLGGTGMRVGGQGRGVKGYEDWGSGDEELGVRDMGWEDSVSSSDCMPHSITIPFPFFFPFPNIWDISHLSPNHVHRLHRKSPREKDTRKLAF